MAIRQGTMRVCPEGHRFYKSSDCLVCPHCEAARQPAAGFMKELAAPARRALEAKGIHSIRQLARYSEAEILALHGIGKTSIPILKNHLKKQGLTFKK
ncbi:MAG: DNA-directed RNA polymerase subunit alpha C-terminal domain-containing protein [Ferruginibacter sp.]